MVLLHVEANSVSLLIFAGFLHKAVDKSEVDLPLVILAHVGGYEAFRHGLVNHVVIIRLFVGFQTLFDVLGFTVVSVPPLTFLAQTVESLHDDGHRESSYHNQHSGLPHLIQI